MATAKKTAPTAPATMPGMPDQRQYQIKDAADTLKRAEEIKKDRGLMKEVKAHVKDLTKAVNKK